MEIFTVNIASELDVELYEKLLSFVDKDKNIKINKLKNNDDRIRTLIADVLIRGTVCDMFQIPNEEIKYEYNSFGKPKLKNSKNFHFNISHSGNWVVAVIDHFPVGIDIEHIRPIDSIDIAKSFFNVDEYHWLITQEDQVKNFYKLWTLKESYLKAIGAGLSIPLDSFSIVFEGDDHIRVKDNRRSGEEMFFKIISIESNYVMSVCSQKAFFTINMNMLNFHELHKKILTKNTLEKPSLKLIK